MRKQRRRSAVFSNSKFQASGGFRGGSRGSLEPPSGAKLFHFHREFQEILCETRLTNPPFLHLNPLLRNPGSTFVICDFTCRFVSDLVGTVFSSCGSNGSGFFNKSLLGWIISLMSISFGTILAQSVCIFGQITLRVRPFCLNISVSSKMKEVLFILYLAVKLMYIKNGKE